MFFFCFKSFSPLKEQKMSVVKASKINCVKMGSAAAASGGAEIIDLSGKAVRFDDTIKIAIFSKPVYMRNLPRKNQRPRDCEITLKKGKSAETILQDQLLRSPEIASKGELRLRRMQEEVDREENEERKQREEAHGEEEKELLESASNAVVRLGYCEAYCIDDANKILNTYWASEILAEIEAPIQNEATYTIVL